MAALPFLDTNILLRHLLQDVPEQSSRASAYIRQVAQGTQKVRIAATVIFETVFTLQRSYHVPKQDIAAALLPLLELPGIVLPGKRLFRVAFEYYANLNISFADAYHAALMKQLKLTDVVTFDRDFNRVPGITRIEPS
ncbi:MAG TPA: PIN domain-containing protein [Chloroflexota bacterium]|nr:PIN domain-containing protein [Chloroflexota bacterium]